MTGIPAPMRGDDMKFSLGELRIMMMGGHNDPTRPFISRAQLTRLEMGPMPDEDNWAFKKARDDMKAPAYKKEYVKKEVDYDEIPRVKIASTTTTLDEIMTNNEQVLDRVKRMCDETKPTRIMFNYGPLRDKRKPAKILQDIKKSRTMTKLDWDRFTRPGAWRDELSEEEREQDRRKRQKRSENDDSEWLNDTKDNFFTGNPMPKKDHDGYMIHKVHCKFPGQKRGEPRVFRTNITEEEAHELVTESHNDPSNYNTQVVNYECRCAKTYVAVVDQHKSNPGCVRFTVWRKMTPNDTNEDYQGRYAVLRSIKLWISVVQTKAIEMKNMR